MSLRRRSGVSGKSKTASRKPKPYFFNANLYLTPKFTHFMAISSNMASKRSSQKEAMKPMLKVRESYSAMSFTDAAGGSSQTGINPPSSRNSLRGIVAFGKSPFGECGPALSREMRTALRANGKASRRRVSSTSRAWRSL